MSHFVLLVVGDNIDKQLEPYNQDVSGTEPWAEFLDQRADPDTQEDYKSGSAQFYYCSLREKWISKYRLADERIPKDSVTLEEKFYRDVMTFTEYLENWCGFSFHENLDTYGYHRNPNAQWDWYEVGGRWDGTLLLKEGLKGTLGVVGRHGRDENLTERRTSIARVGDVDWAGMAQEGLDQGEKSWSEAAGEDPGTRYFRYGIDQDDTKESYLKKCSGPSFFAYLKDGKWFSKGDMGWFGISYNECDPDVWRGDLTGMLESLDPDTTITVVDCHI